MKKAVLPGPDMKTEDEGIMKWKGKKYNNVYISFSNFNLISSAHTLKLQTNFL
jgi:hypothetical protein